MCSSSSRSHSRSNAYSTYVREWYLPLPFNETEIEKILVVHVAIAIAIAIANECTVAVGVYCKHIFMVDTILYYTILYYSMSSLLYCSTWYLYLLYSTAIKLNHIISNKCYCITKDVNETMKR
jgi:hypothetical protein